MKKGQWRTIFCETMRHIKTLCAWLSKVIADAKIVPLSTDERTLATEHMKAFEPFADKRDLLIFDRGYPSKDLITTLEAARVKYLMRVSTSFSPEIDKGTQNDYRVTLAHGKKRLFLIEHSYQANEKMAIKQAKHRLVSLMSQDDPTVRAEMFDDLVRDIASHRSEIRPGRHYDRPTHSHHRKKHRTKTVL